MKSVLNETVERLWRDRQRARRYALVFVLLAAVTTLAVNWSLHKNGISMTADYICGEQEHTHTEDCYTRVLVCEQTESEGTAGHTHTEDCYREQTVLVCAEGEHAHDYGCFDESGNALCGSEEHSHGEECYDEAGNLICGLAEHRHDYGCFDESGNAVCGNTEHTHTDACYETQRELVCGQEESESADGHTHTEDCYEAQLTCGLAEHSHTAACLGGDASADVETAADWEATLPEELTGVWAEDVVAVAKSQLGYTESTKNYILGEDGTSLRGYTRYGEWYGNRYGDWCAMFAAFCLHYAEVPAEAVPVNSGCAAWIAQLKNEDVDLYRESGDYTPEAGDLVFFDWDGDGSADHVGIVTGLVYEEQDSKSGSGEAEAVLTGIETVEGNSGDAVRENRYETDDEAILGYGELPEREISYPAFACEQTMEDGTVIRVEAPEGAFPEGIQLALAVKDAAEYMEALQAFAGDEELTADSWLAYDFDFYTDAEHHNIEPLTEIRVTFSNIAALCEQKESDAEDAEDEDASAETAEAATAEETADEAADKNGEAAGETAADEDDTQTGESAVPGITVYHIGDAEAGESRQVSRTAVSAVDVETGTVEIESSEFSTQIIRVTANAPGGGGGPQGGGSQATDSTTVDHIDIGISANASVTVNGKTSTVTVGLEKSDFTSGNVTVTAKRESGKSVTVDMNGNISTSTGTSGISQVRVNGTYSTGTLSDPAIYTFTLKKKVTFTIEGKEVTLPVTLESTFQYFSDDNDCPGIHNNQHLDGYVSNESGFDFVLKFDLKLVTISKQVVDESGNPLNVSNYTVYFDVTNSADSEAAEILIDNTYSGWAIEQVKSLDDLQITEREIPETVTIEGVTYTYLKTLINDKEGTKSTVTGDGSAVQVKNVYSAPQKLRVLKYEAGETSKLLPGAQFTLTAGEGESLLYYKTNGEASTEEIVLITDDKGAIAFENLVPGTYTLTEIQAPAGYNTLTEPIVITVASSNATYGDETIDKDEDGYYEVKVTNEPGFTMPETGGAGWIPFTAAGAGLMALALLMYGFCERRRRERRVE